MKKTYNYLKVLALTLFTTIAIGQTTIIGPAGNEIIIDQLNASQNGNNILSPNSTTIATGLNQPQGIAVLGDEAFITNRGPGEIVKIDLNNPGAPFEVILGGYSFPIGIAAIGSNIYFTDDSNGGSLYTFDSTQANPVVTTLLTNQGGFPQQMVADGSFIYFTPGGAVSRFDTANPGAGVEVLYLQSATTFGLEISGSTLYFSEFVNGGANNPLYSKDLNNLNAPEQLVGTYPDTMGSIVTFDNNLLTSDDISSSIYELDFSQTPPTSSVFETGTQGGIALERYNNDLLFATFSGGTIEIIENVFSGGNMPPTAVCQNITVQLDAMGSVTIAAADIDGGSTDPDGTIASLTIDVDTFNCSNIGANTVTLTVTDNDGDSTICTAMVTIEDDLAPVISCSATITQDVDAGSCDAVVTFATPTATDNCIGGGPGNILVVSDNAGGTEIETALAGEGYNVTAVYSDFVSGDNTALQGTISQYDAIYWNANGGGFGAVHNTATFTNLDTYVANGGSVFVTGYDVISSPIDSNLIAFLGGTGSIDSGNSSNGVLLGGNSLTTGAVDISGNMITAPFFDHDDLSGVIATVAVALVGTSGEAEWSVNDVPGGEIAWVSSGQVGTNAMPAWTTPGSNYHEALLNFAFNNAQTAGGAVTVTQTAGLASGSVFPAGTTTNTFEATDANGNVSTCSFDVIVEENEAPTITCPADETVMVNQGDQFTLPDYIADGDAVAMDNCTFTTTQTPAAGTMLSAGTYTIEFEVEDVSGNATACDFELIVDEILGTNDQAITNFTLFPNPATTQITIKGDFDIASVEVYNVVGQKVLTSTAEMLNIQDLSSGMYLVQIMDTEGNKATKRFVKQ